MEFLQRIPAWVWIAGAAAVAYFLFFRKSSSASGLQTTGGGGSVTTGNTRIDKGAISISVMQNGQGKGDQDQPSPPTGDMTKQIIVPKDETLAQLAKYLHWSDTTLSEVEEMNAVGGQELTPASKLTKGQTIVRPIEST